MKKGEAGEWMDRQTCRSMGRVRRERHEDGRSDGRAWKEGRMVGGIHGRRTDR